MYCNRDGVHGGGRVEGLWRKNTPTVTLSLKKGGKVIGSERLLLAMAESNMFAKFAKPEKGASEAGAKGKKKKNAVMVDDEDRPDVVVQSMKGFKVVESKPKRAKKPKEERAKMEETAEGVQIRKPKPKPKTAGPVGSRLVDPAQEKAEKKAAAALQRHLAAQVVKTAKGDAITKRPQLPPGWQPPKDYSDEPLGKKNTQEEVTVTATATAPSKHSDPLSAAKPTPKAAQRQAQAKQQRPPRAEDESAPSTQKGKEKKALPASAEEAHFASHTDAAPDGTKPAFTRFCFVFKSGRVLPLFRHTTANVDVASPQAIAAELNANRPVRGGFCITVDGKHFADETLADQIWMTESYYKGAVLLLSKEKSEFAATPFWPNVSGQQAAEIDLHMRVSPDLAVLELSHDHKHFSPKVPLKQTKISFRPFVESLLKEGAALVALLGQLEGLVPSDVLESNGFPKRLKGLVEDLAALAGPAEAPAATAAA